MDPIITVPELALVPTPDTKCNIPPVVDAEVPGISDVADPATAEPPVEPALTWTDPPVRPFALVDVPVMDTSPGPDPESVEPVETDI